MSIIKLIANEDNKLEKTELWYTKELENSDLYVEIIGYTNNDDTEIRHIKSCDKMKDLIKTISKSYLIIKTKNAMMQNQDCFMWNFCDGNLDNVNELTALHCIDEDIVAKEIVENYIENLSKAVKLAHNIFKTDTIILKVFCKEYCDLILSMLEEKTNDIKIIVGES